MSKLSKRSIQAAALRIAENMPSNPRISEELRFEMAKSAAVIHMHRETVNVRNLTLKDYKESGV